MNTPFSLAHLTMLSVPPPQLVETAARAGYRFVSLRPIPVGAPNEPLYPLGTDRALLARTKAALSATGVGLLDIEVARIIKEVTPQQLSARARGRRRARRAPRAEQRMVR